MAGESRSELNQETAAGVRPGGGLEADEERWGEEGMPVASRDWATMQVGSQTPTRTIAAGTGVRLEHGRALGHALRLLVRLWAGRARAG